MTFGVLEFPRAFICSLLRICDLVPVFFFFSLRSGEKEGRNVEREKKSGKKRVKGEEGRKREEGEGFWKG